MIPRAAEIVKDEIISGMPGLPDRWRPHQSAQYVDWTRPPSCVRVCLNNDRDKIKGVQLFGGYGGCILGATSVTVQPTGCSQVLFQSGHEQRVRNTDPPNYVTYQCSSGSVSPTPFFERTNCVGDNDGPDADWESPMHCPNGMVAVGMRLSTRPGGKERRMIDGIALDCSPLQGTP